jgi:hypothetical protein
MKYKGPGGVCHYQDLKDCAATGNLKSHAIKCFGCHAVEMAFGESMKSGACDGSIFASFACHSQQPVNMSHRAHTTYETRYVSLLV